MANTFPVVGASVRVVRGISVTEQRLAVHPERVYRLDRYAKPHGYAVICDVSGASWHVHPESLDEVAQ